MSSQESTLVQCGSAEMSTEEQELLKLYHHSFDDELVDLDLIMDLLHNICSTTSDGEPQHSSGFYQLSFLLSSVCHGYSRFTYVNPWPSEHDILITARFQGVWMMFQDFLNVSFYLLLVRCCPNFSSRIRWDSGNQGPPPVWRQEILHPLWEVKYVLYIRRMEVVNMKQHL